ncbi:MAG: FAD-dependent oxidoreductase [Burkholderiales bacterium]|nr:FAD-dependent oxidoreductase [Burkholderiales bacterium]
MRPRPRVAVVGAGWSGLAAAVALVERAEVSLLEAAPQVGGRARRVAADGESIDNGQHILLGAYRDTLAVITRVEGDVRKLFLRLPLELHFPGLVRLRAPRHCPAPLNVAMALACARGLDWRDKWGMLRLATALSLREPPSGMSVSSLLAAHGQTERARRFIWEPLCVAALNTQAHEASARVFARVIRDALMHGRADSDLLIPRHDLSRIFPDLALTYLEARGGVVRTRALVRGIRTTEAGVSLRLDDKTEEFDAAICALPPHAAAAILRESADAAGLCATLESYDYEPIITCYLWYPPGTRLPSPMIGLSGAIAQWAFDRGSLGGAPGLIAVVVSAAARLREATGPSLAESIDAELRREFPALPPPVRSRVITDRRATFRCTPGVSTPACRLPSGPLYFAGDHMIPGYPATLESAVRSGGSAARLLLADLLAG